LEYLRGDFLHLIYFPLLKNLAGGQNRKSCIVLADGHGFSIFGPFLYIYLDLPYFSFNACRQFIPCSASIFRAWYFIPSPKNIFGLFLNLGRPEAISIKETSFFSNNIFSISFRHLGLSFHFIFSFRIIFLNEGHRHEMALTRRLLRKLTLIGPMTPKIIIASLWNVLLISQKS